jgi:hypothetical protein
MAHDPFVSTNARLQGLADIVNTAPEFAEFRAALRNRCGRCRPHTAGSFICEDCGTPVRVGKRMAMRMHERCGGRKLCVRCGRTHYSSRADLATGDLSLHR